MPAIAFEKEVTRVAQFIIDGKTILYPTDTVWGIGCDATNEKSIQRIFEIKKRPSQKSVILLVKDIAQLEEYVCVKKYMLDFLLQQKKPTTIIYRTTKISLANSVYAADGSVAIRIVNHRFCKALIEKIRVPLVSTSANIANESTPNNFEEISQHIKTQVDSMVLPQFEESMLAQPSQIVRFTNDKIEWIRR